MHLTSNKDMALALEDMLTFTHPRAKAEWRPLGYTIEEPDDPRTKAVTEWANDALKTENVYLFWSYSTLVGAATRDAHLVAPPGTYSPTTTRHTNMASKSWANRYNQ